MQLCCVLVQNVVVCSESGNIGWFVPKHRVTADKNQYHIELIKANAATKNNIRDGPKNGTNPS